MSTSFDELLTRIAQADPAADLSARAAVEVDRLVDAIVEVPFARSWWRRSTRTRSLLFVAAALTVGGAGVATARHALEVQPNGEATVWCRERADGSAGGAVIPASSDPVADCAQLWNDPSSDLRAGGVEVPRSLAGCVDENGTVTVLPGTASACAALGYAALPGDFVAGPPGLQSFVDAVRPVLRDECLDTSAARALVDRELSRTTLSGWTVDVVEPRSADETCTRLGIDGTEHRIVLVPGRPFG